MLVCGLKEIGKRTSLRWCAAQAEASDRGGPPKGRTPQAPTHRCKNDRSSLRKPRQTPPQDDNTIIGTEPKSIRTF